MIDILDVDIDVVSSLFGEQFQAGKMIKPS